MTDIFTVIKNGDKLNQTLSSLLFDQFGTPTNLKYACCDDWISGLLTARKLGYHRVLFVDSGTVFQDTNKFFNDINNYPHQGLIGHLVDPLDLNEFFYLHDQAFFIDLSLVTDDDFLIKDFKSIRPKRSETNMHDDYTPLWLSTDHDALEKEWLGLRFGERIISKIINSNRIAVNWQKHLRANKKFLYSQDLNKEWLSTQEDYINLAENQLWIFNNEPIVLATEKILVTPASGLSWIVNVIESAADTIELVDISKVQLDFAKHVLANWDGLDYGKFVWEYMKQHNITHFNIDVPNITAIERLKLKKSTVLIDTVNEIFEKQTNHIHNFVALWNQKKKDKTINFYHSDLVKFLPNYIKDSTVSINVWSSNILNYKYTFLKNSPDDIINFTNAIKSVKLIGTYER